MKQEARMSKSTKKSPKKTSVTSPPFVPTTSGTEPFGGLFGQSNWIETSAQVFTIM
jgi:hypothetical protein